MTSNIESNKTFLLSLFSILTSAILGHFNSTVTPRNGTTANMVTEIIFHIFVVSLDFGV